MREQHVALLFFLLLLAVGQSRAPWVLLEDLREYNATVALPVSTTTDALPSYPPPSTVLATRFTITRDAAACSNLVVDLGLARTVGANTRVPKYVSMWLWGGTTALESGPFLTVRPPLIWSGNVTVPATLTANQAPQTTISATHRFVLPTFAPALATGHGYWLGVSVGIDRAYHIGTSSINEVRWLAASSAIPTSRLTTSTSFRAVDRFRNGLSLRHAALANWTSAAQAEPLLLTPATLSSGIHRLAAVVSGMCTGPSDLSNPTVLLQGPPDLYDAASSPTSARSPSPAPSLASPVPSMSPGPAVSPSSVQVPTSLVTVSPPGTVSSPSSAVYSPSPLVPPTPSVMPTKATPIVAAELSPSASPSFSNGPSSSPNEAPSSWPTSVPSSTSSDGAIAHDGMFLLKGPWGFAVLTVMCLAILGAFICCLAGYVHFRNKNIAYHRAIRRNEQNEFIEVHDLQVLDDDDTDEEGAGSSGTDVDAEDVLLDSDDDGSNNSDAPGNITLVRKEPANIPESPYYTDKEQRSMVQVPLEPPKAPARKGKGKGKK
jgi:hypothetical protein